MIVVTDAEGYLGTIRLDDERRIVADPPGLARIVESRMLLGLSLTEAFDVLERGWSNGYIRTIRGAE